MQQALDLALEQAGRHGARRIQRIALRVGALSGVVPEALEFAFGVVTRGTIAEGARLDVELVPVLCSCPACGLDFRPAEPGDDCPRCMRPRPRVLQGRELELAFLEVS